MTRTLRAGPLLLTGAGGFLGPHLVDALRGRFNVVGAGRRERPEGLDCEWLQVPATSSGLAETVIGAQPLLVVHAAFVNRKSEEQSEDAYLNEVQSTERALFEACASVGAPVLLVSSSAVYGSMVAGGKLRETSPRRPVSLYGFAKTLQEITAEYAMRRWRLRLCTARLFNLLGPGRGTGTVLHDWVAQLARIEPGLDATVLRVRHLRTSRDFVDPRDVSRGLSALAERLSRDSIPAGDVFNIASGRSVSLRQISERLASVCPLRLDIVEMLDETPVDDIDVQLGDATKLRALCGWRPEIAWERSVEDVWRQYAGESAT